jgi:hypothetical protein
MTWRHNPKSSAYLNQSGSLKPLVLTPSSKTTSSEDPDELKAAKIMRLGKPDWAEKATGDIASMLALDNK